MKLEKLQLSNFRQFKQETIEFAKGPDKGVTVVHGANGSGKTTLLNAFTWLFYDEVDFDTRPDRLVNEGSMAAADQGDELAVSVELWFEHETTKYHAKRTAEYAKRSPDDFDGEILDINLTVQYRSSGKWSERGNPENTLDKIIPERLSNLFFFDGEDIEELAGIDNQGQIQESIQNIMGLTILERSERHLGTVADRFESEVEEFASDELTELIEEKQELESDIEGLNRKLKDTNRSIEKVKTGIRDIDQKLERLDDSAALQERRQEYRTERERLENRIDELTEEIRDEIDSNGVIPLSMPLIQETAEELDEMRKEGKIPSELNNSYIDSLLESGQCLCGRPLVEGATHYEQVDAMKGDNVDDGVEQSALRIIGHLNQASEMESAFFDNVDDLISKRKGISDEVDTLTEKIDDISSELQGMDQTTESGESISDLESKREEKKAKKEELIAERGGIKEKIEQKNEKVEDLESEIDEQRDERKEALLAKRRQRATELVQDELGTAFDDLQDKVRQMSNKKIKDTFDKIASKNLTAEINENFKLKIWKNVGGNQIEVDKSTGERQIASLAFIGSLVDIARNQYESDSDSEYFTGGIYPLVMDSPFGALDKDHRREVSRVIPSLANQVVVFATDSQWEGPVQEEMTDKVGKQYWLNFDDGDGDKEYPRTRVEGEQAARGD